MQPVSHSSNHPLLPPEEAVSSSTQMVVASSPSGSPLHHWLPVDGMRGMSMQTLQDRIREWWETHTHVGRGGERHWNPSLPTTPRALFQSVRQYVLGAPCFVEQSPVIVIDTIGAGVAAGERQPSLSITHVESSRPLPNGKRYLRDYPDSAKVYNAKERYTTLTLSSGYILQVPDTIKEWAVLEDTLESKLLRNARIHFFGHSGGRKAVALEWQTVDEYGEEKFGAAVEAIRAETDHLYSPAVKEMADLMVKFFMKGSRQQQWWRDNTHVGPDGFRRLNIPYRPSLWEVVVHSRESMSIAHAFFKRRHPVAVLSAKVATVALVFFFCVFYALHAFRHTS